jgi:hypothetical protein
MFRQTHPYLDGARLGIMDYRQIVVGIAMGLARRQLSDKAIPVKPYNKRSPENVAKLLPLAQQAGHTLRTFLMHYGNDCVSPNRLQPKLLARYDRVSKLWHAWLDLDTSWQRSSTPTS